MIAITRDAARDAAVLAAHLKAIVADGGSADAPDDRTVIFDKARDATVIPGYERFLRAISDGNAFFHMAAPDGANVEACDAADIILSDEIAVLEDDVLNGASLADVSKEADVIGAIVIEGDAADGVAAAVIGAPERTCCAAYGLAGAWGLDGGGGRRSITIVVAGLADVDTSDGDVIV